MAGLVPFALRSLRARPARTLLTLAGIALGVAVLFAGLAVNAGIEGSIDRTVAALVGRADVRISAFAERGLSPATLAAIEATPGVAVAAPASERRTFVEPSVERPALTPAVTVLGVDPGREPRVRDLALVAGSPLARIDEPAALVTERLAHDDGLGVGTELTLMGAGEPVRLRVVGILAGDGPLLTAGGRTVVVPLDMAARLAPLPDGGTVPAPGLARIDVVLAAGADADTVTDALVRSLTVEPYVIARPADVAASLRASTGDVRTTTGLLAAIALFAGAFLIANTLAMTVVERVRELGLLRAAGASRGQVARVVGAQAAVLGVAGSAVGVVAGVALADLLAASLRASGAVPLDRPDVSAPIIAASFAIGVLVTLVAAIEPARRARAVSPVEALRARGRGTGSGRPRIGWLLLVLVVVAGAASAALPWDFLPAGLVPAGLVPAGPARTLLVYALLLAAVLIAPVVLGPLGRVAGAPFALLLRLEERLARAAIVRDRGRTALTVGALVVGLAMVVALGAVATNARQASTAWLADVVPGDEVLTAIAPIPLDGDDPEAALEAVDGVALASPIGTFDLAFDGRRIGAAAMRGADLAADGRLRFLAGDRDTALAALDGGGVAIVPVAVADTLGVGLDDVIAVAGADGTLVELRVAGVVERSLPSGASDALLVGWDDATGRLGAVGADAFAVRYEPGRPAAVAEEVGSIALERALTPTPLAGIEGAVTDALDRVFGLFDLLALAAVVVAALGIVNTLSMDVWERVREIGVLRAAGMSRRQVWRSVLVEAGVLGVIAVIVGGFAGLVIGGVLVATAGGRLDGVGFAVPWATLGAAAVLGVAVSMLASAWPARIASRLEIARAVRAD